MLLSILFPTYPSCSCSFSSVSYCIVCWSCTAPVFTPYQYYPCYPPVASPSCTCCLCSILLLYLFSAPTSSCFCFYSMLHLLAPPPVTTLACPSYICSCYYGLRILPDLLLLLLIAPSLVFTPVTTGRTPSCIYSCLPLLLHLLLLLLLAPPSGSTTYYSCSPILLDLLPATHHTPSPPFPSPLPHQPLHAPAHFHLQFVLCLIWFFCSCSYSTARIMVTPLHACKCM